MREPSHAEWGERSARDHVARLQAFTAALAGAATPEAIARLAVSQGRATLRAETALLYARDELGALRLIAQEGVPEEHLEGLRVIPPGSPLPGQRVIEKRTPLWIESFDDYEAQFPELAERMRALGRCPCFAVIPLLAADRALGVIAFGYPAERRFAEGDRSFALTLAHACAQAFDRARLAETERRLYERFRILAEAGDLLSRSLEWETTLRNVAELAMPALADFCFFDVREDDGGVRRISGAHDDPEALQLLAGTRWAPTPPELGLCALSSGRTGFHPDIDRAWRERVALGPEHLELLERLQLRSMVTVPLSRNQEIFGALTLCFGRSGRQHSRDEVALCEEIARRAAFAVDHARLYRRAERASRAKDVFLGMVSHELRTPLTAILGWSSFLADGARRGVQNLDEPLRVIQQSAIALARLVDDMLDVSRVIAGKLRLSSEPVGMAAVIESARDTLAETFRDKTQTLEIRAECQGPVVGDPIRLQQVVCNLLVNAAKFTPEGGRIEVELAERDDRVCLTVRDNGLGIPPDEIGSVFEVFSQADASSTRSHGGLGLGLAIVRQLVELHGGSVRAESKGLGHGAAFVVELPRSAETERPAARGAAASSLEGKLAGRRVLVVDDQKPTLELLSSVLGAHGADVDSASSAADALELFERQRPQVVVSDIAMPGEDGLALMRKLRVLERQRGLTPALTVALTAHAAPGDRERALAGGFDLHVAKPIQPTELVRLLADGLTASRKSA